jgi:hypothetical protein
MHIFQMKPNLKWFFFLLVFTIVLFGTNFIIRKTPHITSLHLESLDKNRFFLNKIAFQDFLDSPFFGKGIAHLPTSLTDPTHSIPNPEKIIDNPSFPLGIMGDTGIIGSLVIILWILYNLKYYQSFFSFYLLFLSGFIGYHIVHPDNAFWILLSFSHIHSRSKIYNTKTHYPIFILSTLYLFHTTYLYFKNPKGPEYRYEINQVYQNFAFQKDIEANEILKQTGISSYHNFKGRVKWKLKTDLDSIHLRMFLTQATKQSNLRLKMQILDNQNLSLEEKILTISKTEYSTISLTFPKNAYYLQIDELDDNMKTILSGKHIFSVDSAHFNAKRELE